MVFEKNPCIHTPHVIEDFLSLINFAQEYLIINLHVYHLISVKEKCESEPETCH